MDPRRARRAAARAWLPRPATRRGRGFPAHAGMDPWRRRWRGRAGRLPRPRGDGPLIRAGLIMDGEASPPTRGWTLDVEPVVDVRVGFPAHAGMDRSAGTPRRARPRLPRPRGDGPRSAWSMPGLPAASPPTRGWTRQLPDHRPHAAGFPAHAGMDPTSTAPATPSTWLPRPRGDGPPLTSIRRMPSTASPPTRGWTRVGPRRGRLLGGFPAHAGMDPLPSRFPRHRLRLPRPRGDGPSWLNAQARAGKASPPTRGWTSPTSGDDGAGGGFPAHAGMDPSPRPTRGARTGLPRPRGDGPERLRSQLAEMEASPPTRGWTPHPQSTGRTSEGFPPTRGRTQLDGGKTQAVDGFPAHTGMDRSHFPCRPLRAGLPRPRGDGPACPYAT